MTIIQPDYDFSTAIMRTNKHIYQIAKGVFARNHFILISTTEPAVIRDCQRNRLWHRTANLVAYKDYHPRLHLTTRFQAPKTMRKNTFFMICLDNLEDFVWILRENEGTFKMCYKMMFEIKESFGEPLATKIQQQLLEPFLKISGRGQKCEIKGAVDAAWSVNMQERLAPVIHWTRSYCWESFNLNIHIKELGDQCYYTGDYIGAYDEWSNIGEAMCWNHIIMPYNTDDDHLNKEIERFRAICLVNKCLAAVLSAIHLRHGTEESQVLRNCEDIFESQHDVYHAKLPAKIKAIYAYLCGVASLILERVELAHRSFQNAIRLDPARTLYAACLSTTEKLAERQQKNESISRIKFSTVALMTKSLQKLKPISFTLAKPKPEILVVDFEREVLKGLGYTGDLLEDRVIQKEGWFVEMVSGEPEAKPFLQEDVEESIMEKKPFLDTKARNQMYAYAKKPSGIYKEMMHVPGFDMESEIMYRAAYW